MRNFGIARDKSVDAKTSSSNSSRTEFFSCSIANPFRPGLRQPWPRRAYCGGRRSGTSRTADLLRLKTSRRRMCRWLAYRGAPIRTDELLLHPTHSIVAQSLDSPLGAETVNGDGFGFGWYPTDTADGTPGVYRSIEPAWHDKNLREISAAIRSPLFFCHVRAAAGPPIQQTNCHPFTHENWLFMHNGALAQWNTIKRDVLLEIDPALFTSIKGTTDSEALFNLALTLGLTADPIGAMG